MLIRPFGTQERPFALKGAQWRDLEKARDCGLGQIAARLGPLVTLKQQGAANVMAAISAGYLGSARLDDVREPILQGLIGGGMSSTEAGVLVRNVFDEDVNAGRGPMMTWGELAFAIVTDALIGLPDEVTDGDDLGEPKAPAKKPVRRSRTAKPVSPTSTAHLAS